MEKYPLAQDSYQVIVAARNGINDVTGGALEKAVGDDSQRDFYNKVETALEDFSLPLVARAVGLPENASESAVLAKLGELARSKASEQAQRQREENVRRLSAEQPELHGAALAGAYWNRQIRLVKEYPQFFGVRAGASDHECLDRISTLSSTGQWKGKLEAFRSSATGKLTLLSITNGAAKSATLPSRLKLLDWGENPSTVGPIRLGDRSVAGIRRQFSAGFEKVAIDFEHNTVKGSPEYERTQEPRRVAGYGIPEIIPNDGLYIGDIQWTPAGQADARNYCDLSPAVKLDSGEVSFLHSCALTRNGSVYALSFFNVAGREPWRDQLRGWRRAAVAWAHLKR